MQVRTVLSDGSANSENEFALPIMDRDGEPYDPPVVVTCRAVSPAEKRKIEKDSWGYVKTPQRGMSREMDGNKAADECLRLAVVSWDGITGADGKPLVCNQDTKIHLPEHVKVQILEAALSTEDATASSFREPAGVV